MIDFEKFTERFNSRFPEFQARADWEMQVAFGSRVRHDRNGKRLPGSRIRLVVDMPGASESSYDIVINWTMKELGG